MDAIEPSNYEQAGWSDLTYEYVQALRTALDAEKARADAAEAEVGRFRSERPYIIGANDGWDESVAQGEASETVKSAMVRFWKRLAEVERTRAEVAEAALKTAREAILQEASRDYPQEVVDWLRSIANTLIQEPRT